MQLCCLLLLLLLRHELALTHLRDFEVRQREQWQTDMRNRMQKELQEKESVLRAQLQQVRRTCSVTLLIGHLGWRQLSPSSFLHMVVLL